jgi:toxin ParE1/3/4
MPVKPVVPREAAAQDDEAAIDYYVGEGAVQAACDFVDCLEQAYRHISLNPLTVSPRYAHELNIPGLRFWPITRFPYLIFYVDTDDSLDVWRVLHCSRDIPASMHEPDLQ